MATMDSTGHSRSEMDFAEAFEMARLLSRNREDAEDLAQDTLIRLWRYPDQDRRSTKTLAWRILTNLYIDLVRKRRVRSQTIAIADFVLEDPDFDVVAPTNVFREVAARMELAKIVDCMPDRRDNLTRTQRFRARRRLEAQCST